MGNAFASIVSSIFELFNKLIEKVNGPKSIKRPYYQSEILLKDEENQAGKLAIKLDFLSNDDIKKIIKNRKDVEEKNEYHLIKSIDDHDNVDHNLINNEIEDIQKEIQQLDMENDNKIEKNNYVNMDELKVQILENESASKK